MNISVFGLGYVGSVCIGCLSNMGHSLIGVDISPKKVSSVNKGQPPIVEKDLNDLFYTNFKKKLISATSDDKTAVLKSDISLVCVGTPNDKNGHLNTVGVEKVVSNIGLALKEKDNFHVIVIRSTVPPGTINKLKKQLNKELGNTENKKFDIVMNPEFMREGTAIKDFFHPPYILIGTNYRESFEIIKTMYSKINCEIIQVEPEFSELIKFVNNSFHALKITFANEIGNICKGLNIDSHEFMKIFTKDTILNISSKYLMPGFSYGGSCLPKDLSGLISISKELGIKTPILKSIRGSNDYQTKRLIKLINNLKSKSLGILGLTFKKGTDDVRNNPIINVINHFIRRKYKINVFDPNIVISKLEGENKKYLIDNIDSINNIFSNSTEQLCKDSDLIILCNADQEYFISDHNFSGKLIIDLTRSFSHLSSISKYHTLN